MYIVHILYLNMYKRTKRLIILSVEHKMEALMGQLCGLHSLLGCMTKQRPYLSPN